jgi:hypothetical protein
MTATNTFWRDMLFPFREQKNPEKGHKDTAGHDLYTYLPIYMTSQLKRL